MKKLEDSTKKWHQKSTSYQAIATDDDLFNFQTTNSVILPHDLMRYFKEINGTSGQYDDKFFQFNAVNELKNVNDEYKDWKGIPNYRDIVDILVDSEKYFVFANYSFHLFSYAIKLYSYSSSTNEVLVLCGAEYKKISNSFSEFMELYLNDSIELQLNQ